MTVILHLLLSTSLSLPCIFYSPPPRKDSLSLPFFLPHSLLPTFHHLSPYLQQIHQPQSRMNLPPSWNRKELFQEGCGGVNGFKNADFKLDKARSCFWRSDQIRRCLGDSYHTTLILEERNNCHCYWWSGHGVCKGGLICKPLKPVFLHTHPQTSPPIPHIFLRFFPLCRH